MNREVAEAQPASLEQQIAGVEEAIQLLRMQLPKWVAARNINQRNADQLIWKCEGALQTLRHLRERGRVKRSAGETYE